MRLTNEREDSVASHVLSVLTVLAIADGDCHLSIAAMAVMGELEPSDAQLMGSNVANYMYDAAVKFRDHRDEAVAALDEAIAIDPNNPLPFAFSSYAQLSPESRTDLRGGRHGVVYRHRDTSRPNGVGDADVCQDPFLLGIDFRYSAN